VAGTPKKRDRIHHNMRDMVLSLAALLLIIGSVLFLTRGCSFSPGAPDADPASAPTVDAVADLTRFAGTVDYPVRLPAVPSQWRSNSTSLAPVEPISTVIRVGWLTPTHFIQLSQSGAPLADTVRVETGQESTPTGQVSAGGQSWTVYPGRRNEHAWTLTLDGVTLVITGSAPDPEFHTLATTTLTTLPIPRTP
jgi:hypothetical protein